MLAHRCPYCKDDIAASDTTWRCANCGSSCHVACWEQNNGCAVFGCRKELRLFTHRRMSAPSAASLFSAQELISEASAWCATLLGLAFLIFLPATMTALLALPAEAFRDWVLTEHYLQGALFLSASLSAVLLRAGIRNRNGFAGFVLAILMISIVLWSAGELWTHAHLPY